MFYWVAFTIEKNKWNKYFVYSILCDLDIIFNITTFFLLSQRLFGSNFIYNP